MHSIYCRCHTRVAVAARQLGLIHADVAVYSTLYPRTQVSTAFQLALRMYYPTPGIQPPSILPCTEACQPQLKESYIPPSVKRVP